MFSVPGRFLFQSSHSHRSSFDLTCDSPIEVSPRIFSASTVEPNTASQLKKTVILCVKAAGRVAKLPKEKQRIVFASQHE